MVINKQLPSWFNYGLKAKYPSVHYSLITNMKSMFLFLRVKCKKKKRQNLHLTGKNVNIHNHKANRGKKAMLI